MKADIRSWAKEFSLSEEQLQSVEAGCLAAVESFRRINSKKIHALKDSMAKIKKLQKLLGEMNEDDFDNLAIFSIVGNKKAIEMGEDIFSFARIGRSNFQWLCEQAIKNYRASNLSKGVPLKAFPVGGC